MHFFRDAMESTAGRFKNRGPSRGPQGRDRSDRPSDLQEFAQVLNRRDPEVPDRHPHQALPAGLLKAGIQTLPFLYRLLTVFEFNGVGKVFGKGRGGRNDAAKQ